MSKKINKSKTYEHKRKRFFLYDNEYFAGKIRELRQQKGLTLAALSKDIFLCTNVKISAQQLSKYERASLGEFINVNNLFAICKYYRQSPFVLLKFSSDFLFPYITNEVTVTHSIPDELVKYINSLDHFKKYAFIILSKMEAAKILLAGFASIIEINQSIRRCQQDYRFESHENRIRLEKRVRDLHYETEKQKKLMWSILDKTLTKFEKLDLELSIENFINQKGEIYERHNKRSERLQ